VNTASTSDSNLSGGLTSNDHNLIGGDPKLGLLANNGGPTDTRALFLGSPAIDAGAGQFNGTLAPTTDQRGYGRNGTIDIGAFEFDGVPPPAYRIDALIKKNSETSTAFALDNVYQLTPHGAQIENQSVSTGGTAIYQVKIENETNVTRTFGVKVVESAGAAWTIEYKKGTTNISTAIRSTAGYTTGVLTPGANEIITLEMTPSSGASASKSSSLKVFMGGADKVTRDAVKATTTVTSSGDTL
jgi:hypothetical protein